MKKLVFGLIATMMISFIASGQTLSEQSKKNIINTQMVTIVNVSKTVYVKGQTYNDFVKALMIPSPTLPSQDEFFKKVYSYVSTNAAECDILKADNSVLSKFAIDMSKNPKNMSTPNATYSGKKKWWQILINTVINVALTIYVDANHDPVDLWPEAN